MRGGEATGVPADSDGGWVSTALALTAFSATAHEFAELFRCVYRHVLAGEPEDGLGQRLRVEVPRARQVMYADLCRRAAQKVGHTAGRLYAAAAIMLASILGQDEQRQRLVGDLLRSDAQRMPLPVLAFVRNIRDGRRFTMGDVRAVLDMARRDFPDRSDPQLDVEHAGDSRSADSSTELGRSATPPDLSTVRGHAPDFSSVRWDGQEYRFSGAIQRKVVELFWADYECEGTGLSEEHLREESGSSAQGRFRLSDLFRAKGRDKHPAIGTLLRVVGTRVWRIGGG